MKTFESQTRAGAWLDAAECLYTERGPIYNLLIEVTAPALGTEESRAIEAHVDEFLAAYDCQPIHTVAETIFPATEYLSGGLEKVYDYPQAVFPFIQPLPSNNKGTYVQRLVKRQGANNHEINPLRLAISKLQAQVKRPGPMKAVYEFDLNIEELELKLYDPHQDHSNIRGGQCLSHISLKLGPKRELYLTALYRYQYFAQKALGNLKGLARLQACIAKEVGIPVGPLVCHATLAQLETGAGPKARWGRPALAKLLQECRAIESNTDSCESVA